MISDNNIFLLKGKVQHYDWGGYTYLPELLHFDNQQQQPCAEYWMGAHNSAPSVLVDGQNEYPLNELIQSNPEKFLGKSVYEQFGELPFLYKILDVKEMLSIQVHPSKTEAGKGFEKEEMEGIDIKASNRNYKDKNHKPEVMIALSEFWLLHGFLQEEKLKDVLQRVDAFKELIPILKEKGTKGLYRHVMEMSQEDANALLQPLVSEVLAEKRTDKSTPEYWVQKLFQNKNTEAATDFDKGIFSIYFFNIVKAEKGEAVFQGAGLPHAYLEGQNVELMANSDNVLRGGLTSKHVDVPELLKHTSFKGIVPESLTPRAEGAEKIFECPVPDFGISEISLQQNETIELQTHSLEILFVLQGNALFTSEQKTIEAKSGEAVAVLPESNFSITSQALETIVYKAFVPVVRTH